MSRVTSFDADQSGEFEESQDFVDQSHSTQIRTRNRTQVLDDEEFGVDVPDYSTHLTASQVLHNQRADEAVDLSDHSMEDSVHSGVYPEGLGQGQREEKNGLYQEGKGTQNWKHDGESTGVMVPKRNEREEMQELHGLDRSDDEEHDDQEDDRQLEANTLVDDDPIENDPELARESFEGLYNPDDYADLDVSPEVKSIFNFITRFVPQEVEIETFFKPFIPDYIPSIGELDAFIKVPRPDEAPDTLGLTVLDEPAALQSDPSALELSLRLHAKQNDLQPVNVRSIENADKNSKKIQAWIINISDVAKQKPAPVVNYSKNMPDLEQLMQVWPAEKENVFKSLPLPDPDLDISLADYAKICCALLDIPVHDNLIESLHHMFSLYLEFENNFQKA